MEFSVVFVWTNGTALFLTKETKQVEPHHLIGSFGCQSAGVWVHINENTPATPPAITSDVSAALLKYSFAFVSHFPLKMVAVFQPKRSYKKIVSQ